MTSKQKSIFDKAIAAQLKKEKVREELIPFEESIFAPKKKDKLVVHSEHLEAEIDCVSIENIVSCPVPNDKDDEDDGFIVHDDEVPFEESIFAKQKKSMSSSNKVFSVDKKIDYEALFNKYKDIYMNEYISNTKRLNMVDSNIFNNCCVLLEKSRDTKVMNTESYDIVKRVIKNACTCVEDVFYSYTNLNVALIDLVIELNPKMDTIELYSIIDRSYAEVIEELGGRHGENSKVC